MKKLGIALAVILIALNSLPLFAAVDLPVFEGTFVRGAGKPVAETRTFPGISGPATIKLFNGGAGDSTTKRVSSSEVRVNGVLIFGPSNFNQNVSSLQAELTLNEGDNSLEVLLKSKPGGKVAIQVVQKIDAEGAGFIGPEGGVVEVTEPSSPVRGVRIEIPQGSASDNGLFTIALAPADVIPPNSALNVSEIIELRTSSRLNGYVFLTIPIKETISADDSFKAIYYDETRAEWRRLNIIGVDTETTSVDIATTHFTNVAVQKSKNLSEFPTSSSTSFKYNRDRFHPTALNTKPILEKYGLPPEGICNGFAQYPLWYYFNKLFDANNDTFGMSCRWLERKSVAAAYYTSQVLNTNQAALDQRLKDKIEAVASSIKSTMLHLIEKINTGTPEILLLAKKTSLAFHNILIYDYRVISENEVQFYCYEPSLAEPAIMTFKKGIVKWYFEYLPQHFDFSLCAPDYLGDLVHDQFESIYNSQDFVPDDWCVDSDQDGIFDDGDGSGIAGDNKCQSGNTYDCDDNCPNTYNPDQADSNGDGIGDACDEPIGSYSLPDTGQLKCYNNSSEVPCPNPGAPFYGQDGNYLGAQPAYQVSPDGRIVKDLNTGLVWQQTDDGVARNWYNAMAYCEDLNLGGHSDWRLPSYMELVTIVDYGRYNPAVNPAFGGHFYEYWSSDYWSSTTTTNNNWNEESTARFVRFYNGLASLLYKSWAKNARCVRGSQLQTGPFVDNGDGTVTDTGTNLIWQQAEHGGMWMLSWQQALSYCEDLDLAGQSDWRLPNISELQSIVGHSGYNPAIDPVFSSSGSYLWSSTTTVSNAGVAWATSFYYGYTPGDGSKSIWHNTRCVRGGP